MNAQTVTGDGGTKLHVQEAGKRSGKPILFLHGFSQCSLAWSKQLNSDLADSFRLVALDLRGHGLSDKPRGAYGDSAIWANDVHAVIEQLDLPNPILVGWSYGGVIISDYVARYGEGAIAGTNWVAAINRLGEPLMAGGFLGAEFLALAPGFFSENAEESVSALRSLIRLCIPSGLSPGEEWLLLGFNAAVPPHVRVGLLSRNLNGDAVVAGMRKPMLLTWGDKDKVVLPAMRDHIAGLARHAKVSTYPGAGHASFWDMPERFNRELRELREAA
ncbi:MAG TPA: alpha/beta hydrolase [Gammaproteobacteria bacterium]